MKQQTPKWQASSSTSEPSPGVFFIAGPASNWIVVRDETGFMVIDSGYPSDRPLVLESIRRLGLRPSDARAMLITHGHVDHTGSAAYFSETYGTPILCAAEELAHVQGKEKHQVTFGQVIVRAWRPRVFRWMVHVIKSGALKAKPAADAQAWSTDTLKNLPGKPEAVLLPGHTPGSVAILLPAAGAIAVGDSFVSGHPLSRTAGPQMLHHMFHTDPAQALKATHRLDEIEASVVLPGHGSALCMPLADTLETLRGPAPAPSP